MSFCKFSTEYIANNKTEIDNIFINDYLPQAPENCIKVYLYGLYLCNSGTMLDNNLESFSKHLNLDENEIISCFMYWQEQGLVKILSTRPIEIRFIPLKNIFNGVKLYKPEKYEIFNKQAQELFENQREITKNEYYEYYDFLERYHMQQEALLMIMKYCIDNKKSNVGYNYILTVAKNWANDGILTIEDVEQHLCDFEKDGNDISNLLSILGIRRSAFIEERALYKKWTIELGFNLDVIIYLAKNLKKRAKPNFEKLDSLIMKYFALGLFSVIEIEAYENKKSSLYELARKVNNAIGVYYDNLETVVENYITKWINLGFSEEAILEISAYCRKTSIRTLEGVNDKIQRFFKLGILSCDALHHYFEEILAIDKEISEILVKVGVLRKVNYLDRELYKTWRQNWNMSFELIDYASSLAVGKIQPMQYINSILASWHRENIDSVEKAKNIKTISTVSSPSPSFKGRSYKKEELDALIQSIDEVEI